MRSHGCNANGVVYGSMYVQHMNVEADIGGPSMTRQEYADECDINVLMRKYEATGVLPPLNGAEPQYLDVSNVPDLARAMEIIDVATSAFMALPASVRREFDNDPVKFVAFAENADNIDKMRDWGLAPPKAAPEPSPVVAPAPATPAPSPGPKEPAGAA